ncbi:MAG: hypothetical protein K9N05_07845 [Candidatus Marinimicrobia bacterium]|nr:hypothetical protein [Candidatus Neomarinimicrobiota bacterium]
MKQISFTICVLLILIGLPLHADILTIAPCDKATVNIFGDIITLSDDEGILRRYVKGKLINVFSSNKYASKINLVEPLKPVLDEPDKIYLLDAANNTVISWDRFLNIRSITPLHKDILSPQAFTVTSEHDWLIYDDFYDHIIQIHPGEGYPTRWGDKSVSGEIDLFSFEQFVLIFLKNKKIIRISDEDGTSLNEFILPDSLNITQVFPLGRKTIGLANDKSLYIWKPESKMLRYLTDFENVIYFGPSQNNQYLLISQDGDVLTTP